MRESKIVKDVHPPPPVCQVCGQSKPASKMMPAALVRNVVAEVIRKAHPGWSVDGYICHEDLNRFRSQYVQTLLETEMGDLTSLEQEVLKSLKEHELLTSNVNAEFEKELTFGERLADRMAVFGGSWKFILIFAFLLVAWVLLNTYTLLRRPFDPYPFILLNLILSCLAAIQAPVIMMSQNRQEAKDRLRSEYDYRVNLKAELEIRQLHDKIDHLLSSQWERLVEIQQVQLDLMAEILHLREHGRMPKEGQTSKS